MIAQSKGSGSKTDFHDETALTRLFIICPKEYTEDNLRQKFQDFGEIEYVQIVRDHKTGENKGFGYVKFRKSSAAAVALENCDKTLKAVWAEPKSAKIARNAAAAAAAMQSTLIPHNPFLEVNNYPQAAAAPVSSHAVSMNVNNAASLQGVSDYYGTQNPVAAVAESITTSHTPTRLFVKVSPMIGAEQLSRLFDIIPGMQMCDLKRNYGTGESKGFAYVTYNSVGSAIYAKEKLNGFEYPLGSKLVVKYAEDPPGMRSNGRVVTQLFRFSHTALNHLSLVAHMQWTTLLLSTLQQLFQHHLLWQIQPLRLFQDCLSFVNQPHHQKVPLRMSSAGLGT